VVAARSHQATRTTGCSKNLIAPWCSIGFASFHLSIEANVTSYAKIYKNPTLRTHARRYEENTKVVAARSHQATRETGCSKKLIAPWYSIGFASFHLSIETNVASYAKIYKNPTLRTHARSFEENTKVVAARSHQATRATGCSKKLIAPWCSIGFASFHLSIEANIASYAKI
jgi:nicotinic acid phosphoribosyltransferase